MSSACPGCPRPPPLRAPPIPPHVHSTTSRRRRLPLVYLLPRCLLTLHFLSFSSFIRRFFLVFLLFLFSLSLSPIRRRSGNCRTNDRPGTSSSLSPPSPPPLGGPLHDLSRSPTSCSRTSLLSVNRGLKKFAESNVRIDRSSTDESGALYGSLSRTVSREPNEFSR